jgi:outer membrane protein OmpA-like peptidoglycan-associated protein
MKLNAPIYYSAFSWAKVCQILIAYSFKTPADAEVIPMKYRLTAAVAGLLGLLALAACTPPPPAPVASAPPAAPPPVPPALPFDQAVLKAANAVLSSAPAPSATAAPSSNGTARQLVVIDPLVNGVTGEQSAATQAIGMRIGDLAREQYPQFDIEPFTPQVLDRSPYVMVGTFTPVNAQNQTTGDREAFRFCLVMADLRLGKTVAKGVARAQLGGVDSTPTVFFRDSPVWTDDARVKSYINTCQATKVGDPISPVYLDGILTASIISEAVDAYTAGHYREAIDLYTDARATKAGDQLRVFNGLYIANWKLGREEPAAAAFGDAVDYSLSNNRLGVKFLFRPESTGLASDAGGPPYDMWLQQIATRSAEKHVCLQVIGNTSKSGSPALNDRLSLLRAEYVKNRLEADEPALHGHLLADGVGSQANLIGTGADDETDALDRRVEFKVIPAC